MRGSVWPRTGISPLLSFSVGIPGDWLPIWAQNKWAPPPPCKGPWNQRWGGWAVKLEDKGGGGDTLPSCWMLFMGQHGRCVQTWGLLFLLVCASWGFWAFSRGAATAGCSKREKKVGMSPRPRPVLSGKAAECWDGGRAQGVTWS